MSQCEDELNTKTAHFRLPSVAQKRYMLKLPKLVKDLRLLCIGLPIPRLTVRLQTFLQLGSPLYSCAGMQCYCTIPSSEVDTSSTIGTRNSGKD